MSVVLATLTPRRFETETSNSDAECSEEPSFSTEETAPTSPRSYSAPMSAPTTRSRTQTSRDLPLPPQTNPIWKKGHEAIRCLPDPMACARAIEELGDDVATLLFDYLAEMA